MMLVGVTRILAAGMVVTAAAALVHGQDRQMGGIGITVYEDAGYRGENATFRDNEPDLSRSRFANRISSLQVTPGEVWEVCAGINYQAPCQIFSGAEPNLARRSWNDRISSMRRLRGGNGDGGRPQPGRRGIVLYSDERFGGEARPISGFAASLGSFNDRAESVRIFSGRWELCEDDGYHKCRIVERDLTNLQSIGLAKRVSSVRPVVGRGDDGFPGNPGGQRPRLVLYDRDRYRGETRTLDDATTALGGFGNRAESAQVIGTWQICDQPNFNGRCVTVSQDIPNLANYGLHGRLSSARPVGVGRR